MTRLSAFLLLVLMACSLGLINAQHRARKLFIELETGAGEAKRLGEEYTQLQLEQGTWATHKRVEAIASRSLGMRLPEPGTARILALEPGAAPKDAAR